MRGISIPPVPVRPFIGGGRLQLVKAAALEHVLLFNGEPDRTATSGIDESLHRRD